MAEMKSIVERLISGPGPGGESHVASDEAGWVTLESGTETKVRIAASVGLDVAVQVRLEAAIAEALDALLAQDSPYARTLFQEVAPHLNLDEVQERMSDQARDWQERSMSIQERINRARNHS